MSRNYPLKIIRYWYAYDVEEICGLYKDRKLHPRTVQGWVRTGLETIDNAKPFLVFGNTLIEFLGKRNMEGRHKTELHEIFCLPCQDTRKPYKQQVHISQRGYLTNMIAVCPDCKNVINKGIRLDDYQAIKKIYAVVDVSQLYDCEVSPANTHLPAQVTTRLNEPIQGELFL